MALSADNDIYDIVLKLLSEPICIQDLYKNLKIRFKDSNESILVVRTPATELAEINGCKKTPGTLVSCSYVERGTRGLD